MSTLFEIDEVRRSAVISPCGQHRYTLDRVWSEGPAVNFIMLNPSTADASEDDPTIRRCVGFARAWGYGGLIVTNLYAFRATDPRRLRSAPDAIGRENNRHIAEAAAPGRLVVCAWGNHAAIEREAAVLKILRGAGRTPHALRMTSLGHPAHPLYLPASLTPFPMEAAHAAP